MGGVNHCISQAGEARSLKFVEKVPPPTCVTFHITLLAALSSSRRLVVGRSVCDSNTCDCSNSDSSDSSNGDSSDSSNSDSSVGTKSDNSYSECSMSDISDNSSRASSNRDIF